MQAARRAAFAVNRARRQDSDRESGADDRAGERCRVARRQAASASRGGREIVSVGQGGDGAVRHERNTTQNDARRHIAWVGLERLLAARHQDESHPGDDRINETSTKT